MYPLTVPFIVKMPEHDKVKMSKKNDLHANHTYYSFAFFDKKTKMFKLKFLNIPYFACY